MLFIPDCIQQSFYTNINQILLSKVLLGKTLHQHQLGFIRKSLTSTYQALSNNGPWMPTRFYQAKTKFHLAKLLYQYQSGLIEQYFYTDANQTSLNRAPHPCQSSILRQSFHININQVSLSRAFILTLTKLYQAEFYTDANQDLLERAFILMLTKSY